MNDNKQLKLLTRTDKSGNKSIVIYDTLADKYYNVFESDVEHIFDDNNELLSADVIRKYFNFKDPEWRKTHQPKPYYTKKVNLKDQMQKQQTEAYNQLLKSQMLAYFKDVGVTMDDIIRFNTKPTIATLNQFSVNPNVRDALVKKYKAIETQYKSSFKKNDTLANFIQDFYDTAKRPANNNELMRGVIDSVKLDLANINDALNVNDQVTTIQNCINRLDSVSDPTLVLPLKKKCLEIRKSLVDKAKKAADDDESEEDDSIIEIKDIDEIKNIADTATSKLEKQSGPIAEYEAYIVKHDIHHPTGQSPAMMSDVPFLFENFVNWNTTPYRKIINLAAITQDPDNKIGKSNYDIIVTKNGNDGSIHKYSLDFQTKTDKKKSSKIDIALNDNNTFESALISELDNIENQDLSNLNIKNIYDSINDIKEFSKFHIEEDTNSMFKPVKSDFTEELELPEDLNVKIKNFVHDLPEEDYKKFRVMYQSKAMDWKYIPFDDPYTAFADKIKDNAMAKNPNFLNRPTLQYYQNNPEQFTNIPMDKFKEIVKIPLNILKSYKPKTTIERIAELEVAPKDYTQLVKSEVEAPHFKELHNQQEVIDMFNEIKDMSLDDYIGSDYGDNGVYYVWYTGDKPKGSVLKIKEFNNKLKTINDKLRDYAWSATMVKIGELTEQQQNSIKQQMQDIVDGKAWHYNITTDYTKSRKTETPNDPTHYNAAMYYNPSTAFDYGVDNPIKPKESKGFYGGNWTSDTLSRLDSLYNRIFRSAGNWSSDTLSRLDSLYNRVMYSSGVCGNWSSDTLSRLDSLYNRVMA